MHDLHKEQMQILRELLYRPFSRFSDLNITNLSSDHFSYHVRIMVAAGLVEKGSKGYRLTEAGKEFAGRMDTETALIEKQPKVSVFVIVEKEFKKQKKYVIQTRLKEPYYGYRGFITGKMRFGETVIQSAARELKEEAGLEAELTHCFVLHEMVYNQAEKLLEDKFFNVMIARNTTGEMIDSTDGKNEWFTAEEYYKLTPLFHSDIEIFTWALEGKREFVEKKYYIESF